MQIFDRLSLLLRANVNAALNAAEDPEKVLDQLIRDAESVRKAAEQQLLVAISERNRIGAEAAFEEVQASKAMAIAEAAVRRGDNERARAALH
ncbi:PspA/IM30 family protein, partial [Xanthomonas citri pv. citri]